MENHPELGFGIMRMPQKNGEIDCEKSKQLIDEYMKDNYCYFDTHPGYMMNQSQRIIREYVVKRYDRERFLLADKMPYYGIDNYRDYSKIFYQELAECGVKYFDYYLLHALSQDTYEMHENFGGFHFLQEMKDEGRIRKIGLSFHDRHELLDEILERHPEIDFVQLQINYLDWENPVIQSKACYEVARKHNKPIIVMEPIKGGRLACIENPEKYARMALKFVKVLPGVHVILSGMSEITHITENRLTLSERKEHSIIDTSVYQNLQRKIEKDNVIPCTECRYCTRECAKGVKIPEIFSLMNAYYKPGCNDRTVYGRIKRLYEISVLGNGGAGECAGCGMCERRCPQKIMIREHLKTAVTMFEEKNNHMLRPHETKEVDDKEVPRWFKGLSEKEVVLWGCGHCFFKNLLKVKQYSRIRYVCDNNHEKWNREIVPGLLCISPEELEKKKDVFVVIMLEDAKIGFEIAHQLHMMGISHYEMLERWLQYADKIKWKDEILLCH